MSHGRVVFMTFLLFLLMGVSIMPDKKGQNFFTEKMRLELEQREGSTPVMENTGDWSVRGIRQQPYDEWTRKKGKQYQDVRTLQPTQRAEYYNDAYYSGPKLNQLPKGISELVFDYGITSHPITAIKSMQAVVGAKTDGKVGPNTIAKLNTMIKEQGLTKVQNELLDAREAHYQYLARVDPEKYRRYFQGWINRVESLRTKLGE